MTLSVRAGFIDASGQDHELPLSSNLAGFESARTSFYGSAFVKRSGAEFLPLLETQAVLRVEGQQVTGLRAEITSLQDSIREHEDSAYWSSRLRNVLKAIEAAEMYGGNGWVEIA